jgi:segregation and condensation protein A
VKTLPELENNQYLVNLEKFQGPLDLLLYLINKEEIDIYDIPIAKITRQYLDYVELMQHFDLELAGEYILMAATLIRLKTAMLLPRDPEEPEEADPRHELMLALIEYRKYKEIGDVLRDKAIIEEGKVVPQSPLGESRVIVELSPGTTFFDLLTAFREMLEAKSEEVSHEIAPEPVSVEERVEVVTRILENREYATFSELFMDSPRKIVAIVTFMALLEMARLRRIVIRQSSLFGDIRVYRAENFGMKRVVETAEAAGEYSRAGKQAVRT